MKLEQQIRSLLQAVLPPAEAEWRARMVIEDMNSIGFRLEVTEWDARQFGKIALYKIEGADFHPDFEIEKTPDVYRAAGSGLDCGDLVRLSKVCKIGRQYFPTKWPNHFRAKLLNPKDHLATIEEFWWLSLWYGVSDVIYEPAAFAGFKKRPDWGVTSIGQRLNLEVKNRFKDWMRQVDGDQFTFLHDSYFDDIGEKFPAKNQGELNIGAVTLMAPISRQIQRIARQFLEKSPNVDALVLWTNHPENKRTFDIQSLNHTPLIESLFNGGDVEDRRKISPILHRWADRDTRKAKTQTLQEEIERVTKIVKEQEESRLIP